MSRASDHAYALIRARILGGEAVPGAPLREEQLAEECGVSRTPIRDALRRLESELFVIRSGSQRSYVADWGREDIEELFALRAMLEAHAAARAATRFTKLGLDALRAVNAAITVAVEHTTPDIPAFLEANLKFHRLIVETAQSPRLAAALALLVEQPIVRRTAMRYSCEQLVQSASEHGDLLQAFAARDPLWASAIMTGHIRRAFQVFAGEVPPTEAR